MTGNHAPSTGQEFQEELSELIERAVANGVDVEGGWDVREAGNSDWSIEITRVRPDG